MSRSKQKQKKQKQRHIEVPELCTALRLAQEVRWPFEKLQAAAEGLGEDIFGPSEPLNAELIELLAMEAGATVEVQAVDEGLRPQPSPEERARLPVRPPVVTLMGHVDHGKTSLLDAFRGSSIASAEAGGITQNISAFTVDAGSEKAMTFIDTPGHELFAAMRQRGARATDVVVLVVAVDAGVQPTTVQAIEYARSTGSPVVVAINKMDRDGADREYPKVVQQLVGEGLVPEDMGGEVPFVGVSAKTGLNLDELRDTVLLQAELLELHAEPDGPAEGLVLEASMQKGLGLVSNVLIQRGCLRPSDIIVAGTSYGKVKALMEPGSHQRLREAPPSTPVRVAGLKELPSTGDTVHVVGSEAAAKSIVEYRQAHQELREVATYEAMRREELDLQMEERQARKAAERHREPWYVLKAKARQAQREERQKAAREAALRKKGGAETPDTQVGEEGPSYVPVLFKADSAGSLEAMQESVAHFPKDRAVLQIIRSELGDVTEGDVMFADALRAGIVGFNVSYTRKVEQQAESATPPVPLATYDVIYDLTDAIKDMLEAAIKPVYEDKVLGETEVLQLFTLTLNRKDRKEGMNKFTQVAGCRVTSGDAIASARVRVHRGPEGKREAVHEGRVVSLKSYKKEVKEVGRGQECGVILNDFAGIEEGDTLTFFDIVARKPSLYEKPTGSDQAAGN